jgi:hypothetical protein
VNTLTWPATFFLSILTMCVSFLVYKGTLTSHALFMIIGAAVGFFPHAVMHSLRVRGRMTESQQWDARRNEFSPEEIVTNNDALRPRMASVDKKDKQS